MTERKKILLVKLILEDKESEMKALDFGTDEWKRSWHRLDC